LSINDDVVSPSPDSPDFNRLVVVSFRIFDPIEEAEIVRVGTGQWKEQGVKL
jgi:hypothetical protein